MVAKPSARKRATYQDVLDAPEHVVAEVIDGNLYLFPRPRFRHARNATVLGTFLTSAFDLGINGPGGWLILFEPELHVGNPEEPDIVVPDIAGWRKERLDEGAMEDPAFITIPPDWTCEVLSKSTTRVDRTKKLPIYAREKVGHVWLADAQTRLIEVFRYSRGGFILVGTYGGTDSIRAEPFAEVEIAPAFVWGRSPPPADESSAKPRAPKKRAASKSKKKPRS